LLTSSGYYEHPFISSRGCDSLVQLYLTFVSDPSIVASLKTTDISCFGLTDGKLSVESISGGNGNYQIIFNNKIQLNQIQNISKGQYKLNIKDRFHCQDSFQFEIKEPEKFVLHKISDTTIVLGEVISFMASGNQVMQNINWQPNSYFTCSTCISTTALIKKSDQITLTAENDKGCQDSISLKVTVNRDNAFYISNAMKTNAGLNENLVLYSYKSAIDEITSFQLYDRFGNMIHSFRNMKFTTNPIILWNGTLNNVFANTDVYTYILDIKLIDGEQLKHKGDVTVFR
jgi:hypothetical protein